MIKPIITHYYCQMEVSIIETNKIIAQCYSGNLINKTDYKPFQKLPSQKRHKIVQKIVQLTYLNALDNLKFDEIEISNISFYAYDIISSNGTYYFVLFNHERLEIYELINSSPEKLLNDFTKGLFDSQINALRNTAVCIETDQCFESID